MNPGGPQTHVPHSLLVKHLIISHGLLEVLTASNLPLCNHSDHTLGLPLPSPHGRDVLSDVGSLRSLIRKGLKIDVRSLSCQKAREEMIQHCQIHHPTKMNIRCVLGMRCTTQQSFFPRSRAPQKTLGILHDVQKKVKFGWGKEELKECKGQTQT